MISKVGKIFQQYVGYEVILQEQMTEYELNHFGGHGYNGSSLIGKIHYDRWDIEEMHPINVGRNLFGVASCMAFLKVIFHLSIHYKFGPILYCIKQVNTKISKIVKIEDEIMVIFLLKFALMLMFVITFQVIWDVFTIIILYMVTMFSFSIGLVSIVIVMHPKISS